MVRRLSPFLIIICLGLAVYFLSLFNTFVWDDAGYIFTNPLTTRFDLVALFSPNTFNSSGYYRPLAAVYFTFLRTIFGSAYFWFHLIQLFLHLAIVSLVWLLLRSFVSPRLALLASLFYLVHPINVESVAYIGASQSQLFVLPGLLALWAVARRPSHKYFLVATGWLTFSLFVKEVGLLFYPLTQMYLILIKQVRSGMFLSLQGLSLAIYAFVRFGLAGVPMQHIEIVRIAQHPLAVRLLSAPKILLSYLTTLVYPARLAINQHWVVTQTNLLDFWLPLGLAALFLGGLIWGGRQVARHRPPVFPAYVFFLIWYLLSQGMLLQVFPLDMTVADRWFYLPLIGLIGCVVLVLSTFIVSLRWKKRWLVVALLALFALSLRTVVRITNFRDNFTLYSHDLRLNYDYNLLNDLAMEYLGRGDSATALDLFTESVSLYPFDVNVSNLGAAFDLQGNSASARLYLSRALSEVAYDTHPHRHLPAVYFNYANFLFRYADYATLTPFVRDIALADYPDFHPFHVLLALSAYHQGDLPTADSAVSRAYHLSPDPQTAAIYRLIIDRLPLPDSFASPVGE